MVDERNPALPVLKAVFLRHFGVGNILSIRISPQRLVTAFLCIILLTVFCFQSTISYPVNTETLKSR